MWTVFVSKKMAMTNYVLVKGDDPVDKLENASLNPDDYLMIRGDKRREKFYTFAIATHFLATHAHHRADVFIIK